MAYADVLEHTILVQRTVERGEWVEGAYDEAPEQTQEADCALFLPQGEEEDTGRGRKVTRPLVLLPAEDRLGAPFVLKADDEVEIIAPELNEAAGLAPETRVRYQVVGAAQPFGRPGSSIIGSQATLRRVDD